MVKDVHVPGGHIPSRHTLENLHTETRTFAPLVGMAAHANATGYEYKKAKVDTLEYWREAALRLSWKRPFTEILDWSDAPVARWFHDGVLNACDNAVDRHVREGRGDRVAFHFVGEPGDTQTITYADMLDRDLWWHDVVDPQLPEHEPEWVEAEHPLFILYTSGTTGTPKGLFHTTGGYLAGSAHTHRIVFDIKPETDVYWCTADVGWITGHSYIVYGPMINGATQVLYEGTPNTPHEGRWWEIIQEYKVTILYTAPTAIRTFMKWGHAIPDQYDLGSLRLLGSVGEPINPEAWMWYRSVIGYDRCPIVDTWWQTETGSILISPLPGVTATKPGSAMTAIPGIAVEVVDDSGAPVRNGEGGYLVITEPWPSMLRGIWGDRHRYQSTYWNHFDGMYFAGDGAKKDIDGDLWLMGRVDNVMNVSGHRLTTTEIEHALVSHPWVAEAAVVGANDEITGQAVVAFVIVRSDAEGIPADGEAVATALRNHVRKQIGPLATPRDILVVAEVPKTRSGKIMRRLLRDVAENRPVGDVTTLADSSVMNAIREGLAAGTAD